MVYIFKCIMFLYAKYESYLINIWEMIFTLFFMHALLLLSLVEKLNIKVSLKKLEMVCIHENGECENHCSDCFY